MNKSHILSAVRPSVVRPGRAVTLLLGAALALGGCQGAATRADPPLAGAAIGGPFALIDQDGVKRTEASFAGKYRLMYFGYTYCPDVCPVDLQKLMAGYRVLAAQAPDKASRLQPIFVTVDPARDTPAVLRQFVNAFDPHLMGLTGTEAQIADVAKRYAAGRQVQAPDKGQSGYLVNHMRLATLFGPDGKPIALIPEDGPPEAIAAELGKWIL